jgi:hypothetical protein
MYRFLLLIITVTLLFMPACSEQKAPSGATATPRSFPESTPNNIPAGTTTDIQWTNVVGASVNGNSLTKNVDMGWGNSGAFSKQSLSGDGYAEMPVEVVGTARAFGLSQKDTGQSYDTIEFAIFVGADQTLYIYESGAPLGLKGTYSAGDVVRVGVESGQVKYWKNGGLLYTSTAKPVFPLFVDAALFDNGASITKAVISAR